MIDSQDPGGGTSSDTDPLAVHRAARHREFAERVAVLERLRDLAPAAGGPLAALASRAIEIVGEVHRHGVCVVPDVLTASEVERLRRDLAPFFAEIEARFQALVQTGSRQTHHIHNMLAKTRTVDDIALKPLLRTVISGLLGADYLFHAGAVLMAPDPGCNAQGLHRDDASFAALARPRMPLVVTAAIALDDFTVQNGATHVAPGSCWWERSRRPQPGELVQYEMPAGSMLVWDGAIFHAGGANRTIDRPRRTLAFNYTRGWLRTQHNQFLSIAPELAMSLPDELQRALGYAQSAKGLGLVDTMDPIVYLRALAGHNGHH